ncbi:DUF3916 domain-containing protein [Erwinia sp. E602]|uniref:DUF3916 domain-containing protein n=1 Tax=Erwinia sp. E602 TaxID=2675378 RepID=UPI001BA921BA|nr:DUF3916 domain-containing protein [Erwinia sp. E602]QUG75477.1 DUF3916 domain-containing protein [Erwinia sp. E602]
MARRLNRDYRSKIRNVPRRLRALEWWSGTFNDAARAEVPPGERYWNYKIPVEINLVEGKHSSTAIRADCAQQLINACSNLISAKGDSGESVRITTVICLPDMFTSEVCIYRSEEYFQGFVREHESEYGSSSIITDRSLAREWGLLLPDNVKELGMLLDYRGYEDPDDWFTGERWYYGNVR